MSDLGANQDKKPKFKLHSASFRDPSGFLYTCEGALYRQVNRSYKDDYERLMTSGLYDKLVNAGMLIPHQEVNVEPVVPDLGYKILQPEPVQFISYPYEWCFSQLKNAASTTLEIQRIALDYGMSLKDSSAYNIQFHYGRPVLIDTLSFEVYQEGKPWDAYRQFCQHFLGPLSLMAYRDIRLSQLLKIYIDGIPLDLVSALLPWRSRLKSSLLLHIHTHASSQKRFASKSVKVTRNMSKTAFQGLVDNLSTGVEGLKWNPSETEWGDYYEEHNYSTIALEHKRELVAEFLEHIQPSSVWDLGANVGLFSRQASRSQIPTLAFDIDPAAVEKNYLLCLEQREKYLLPLVLDLNNPSPSLGWNNRERLSLLERAPAQAVLALALIHHLAISNNVPLDRLASFFRQLGTWLIVEFVPKSDPQVQRLLATRKDIFSDYNIETFERVFTNDYVIDRCEAINDSQRRLYLMRQR